MWFIMLFCDPPVANTARADELFQHFVRTLDDLVDENEDRIKKITTNFHGTDRKW